MILDCATYEQIVAFIKEFKGLSKYCLNSLQQNFPNIPKDTLTSILSHDYQIRMKYVYGKLKRPEGIDRFYNLYLEALQRSEDPGIILRIAGDSQVPPCLIARLILTKHCSLTQKGDSEALVKSYLKDTTQIEDPDLAYETFLCTLYDDQYSHFADLAKNSLGQQYELILRREMTNKGLAFRDEEELRKYGYDKTPDTKLEVPIAVNGFLVHWIESKASFGDPIDHKEYVQSQYSSYWNRFGPGLVIYWFGFLESIADPDEKRFIVSDRFPDDVVQLTPTAVA